MTYCSAPVAAQPSEYREFTIGCSRGVAPRRAPDGLIPLTCNDFRRLFITLLDQPVHNTVFRVDWSRGRRPTRPGLRPATA